MVLVVMHDVGKNFRVEDNSSGKHTHCISVSGDLPVLQVVIPFILQFASLRIRLYLSFIEWLMDHKNKEVTSYSTESFCSHPHML